MRLSKPLLVASLITSFTSNALADAPSGRWDCIIEKAAGVTIPPRAKDQIPRAINFEERHKHFVLSISAALHDKAFCRQTLAHWMPILERDGKFDPNGAPFAGSTGSDPKKMYDMRRNVGPQCFSSLSATMQFFDRDHPNQLVSYDFWPNEFEGQPGEWLKFYEGRRAFEAGEPLDAGPVVYTGSCVRLE